MLLTERSKYGEIQEKMKKKKLENGLLARDIERLEEQLFTKKAQITNNNALLQYWQKEVEQIGIELPCLSESEGVRVKLNFRLAILLVSICFQSAY